MATMARWRSDRDESRDSGLRHLRGLRSLGAARDRPRIRDGVPRRHRRQRRAARASARDLDASLAGLQWTVNGYTLSIAALILHRRLARRPVRPQADVPARRRLVRRSRPLLCALAPTVEMLVAARVLQGVGGALLTPGSLAIMQASFHPERPGAGDRRVVRAHRRRERDRAAARRLAGGVRELALGVPHQPPARASWCSSSRGTSPSRATRPRRTTSTSPAPCSAPRARGAHVRADRGGRTSAATSAAGRRRDRGRGRSR